MPKCADWYTPVAHVGPIGTASCPLQAGVKGPSATRVADRPFFQCMGLEPNTAVWFQRFGTRVRDGGCNEIKNCLPLGAMTMPWKFLGEIMDNISTGVYLLFNS